MLPNDNGKQSVGTSTFRILHKPNHSNHSNNMAIVPYSYGSYAYPASYGYGSYYGGYPRSYGYGSAYSSAYGYPYSYGSYGSAYGYGAGYGSYGWY
jgi:hypothetical protein